MKIEYAQLIRMLEILNPETNAKVEKVTIRLGDRPFISGEVRIKDGIIYARCDMFNWNWLICPKTEVTSIEVNFKEDVDPTELLEPLRAIA